MSIKLSSFEYVHPNRVKEIKEMFRNDYNKGNRYYILTLSEYNSSLYLDVIKNTIPWVKAKRLDRKRLKIWIREPA